MIIVIIAGLMFVATFVLCISKNSEQRWFGIGLYVLACITALFTYFNLI